jgi:glycosyltransferase involved in cell wall biosynthesis
MDMSVVIRCRDDERVFECIGSIDEDVEVLASMTLNEDLQNRLERIGVICCITPKGNLSKTSNIGFEHSSNNKVIITDSDTTFESGCIEKLDQTLDTHKVACAGIRFLVDSRFAFCRLVAEARDYVNSLPLVFTPGIAVRKDLLPEIGGYPFNDPVPWAVDADLNYRIRAAKVPVAFPKDAYIRHVPVRVKHDLRAAYRIGIGCRVSAEHLSSNDKKLLLLLKKELKGVKQEDLLDVLRKKGPSVALYQILWDTFYYAGYHHQKYFRIYE